MPPATTASASSGWSLDQRPVERPATAAVGIVEQQPVAAAARSSGSRPTLERRPDLASAAEARGEARATYSISSPPCSWTACRLSSVAHVGDHVERRVAEHADRQHARLAGNAGQRRGFVRRHLAGAAGNEDEAGERRWPGGAHVRAAIQSAQFDAPEHQLARRLGGVGSAHQRRADEEGVDSAAPAVRRRPRVEMPDSETSRRSGARRASRSVVARSIDRSRRSRLLMPISGAPSASARAHFRLVMDLDQRVHAEAARLGDHRARCVVVEQRQHHQDRVGARDPRLGHLAQIDEEILGEDRAVELAPSRREIVERTAEISAIAQHAERVGDAGIAARQRGRIGAGPDRARRRRSLLDLEDEARARLGERRGEAARASASLRRAARRATRRRSARASSSRLAAAISPRIPAASATARLDEPLERFGSAAGLQRFARHARHRRATWPPCPPSSARPQC